MTQIGSWFWRGSVVVSLTLGCAVALAAMAQLLCVALWASQFNSTPAVPKLRSVAQAQQKPKPKLEALARVIPKPIAPLEVDVDPMLAPMCAGIEALIITESERDPLWSRATVRRAQASGQVELATLYVGQKASDKTLVKVGYNGRASSPAIWFASEGDGLCQTLLFAREETKAKSRVAISDAKLSRAKPERGVPEALARKIQRESDTVFSIDRAAVDEILENPAQWFQGIRMLPGREKKIQIARVPQGSLPEMIGLKSGDLLERVNGFEVNDPQRALEAYARLRTASELKLLVQRRGKPVLIEYRIR